VEEFHTYIQNNAGLIRKLRRAAPQRREDFDGDRGVDGQPGHQQADGQETTDEMEPAGRASVIAGPDA
jgi:hypothetical protein